MAATPDDCERTATVALPTAASPGFISGEVGISAALDAFSTVYELPLTCFKKGQTNKQTDKYTDMNNHYTSLYALRPREVMNMSSIPSSHFIPHPPSPIGQPFFAMRRGHMVYNNCALDMYKQCRGFYCCIIM